MPQRKNKALLIRGEEETFQRFKKFLSENKISTYEEGLKRYQTIVGSEVFLDYQDCQFFSEYPPDSKHFIQCSYGKSGKRPRKREHCQACAHNREIKVPMKSKAKIEQEISECQHKVSEAQHKLGDLNADIVRKTRETEKITNLLTMPEQLKKKEKEIADLRAHYENVLREEKEKNEYLDQAYDELHRQFEDLQTPPPKSVLEVEKRLSEQEQPMAAPPKKTEASKATQIIQKVTERETTTKKERIIETVTSDPFTNQEIQCPLKGQYVDIAKECKKACKDFAQCRFFEEIINGTVPLGAEIRLRQS